MGRVRETEQGAGGGGRRGATVEGGENSMDRQKCGSCENVKEKCVTIKKKYIKKKKERGAGWNLLLQEPKAKTQLSIRSPTVRQRKMFFCLVV